MPGMTKQLDSGEKLAQMSRCITEVAENRDKAAFVRLFDHYAPLIRAYSLDRECICLAVTEGPIQFTGFMRRLLNPFIRRSYA